MFPKVSEIKKAAEDLDRRERAQQKKDLANFSRLLDCRAGKLLLKGKPFIIVACDEPYYLDVYRTIRKHEKERGTWTQDCELQFQASVAQWVEFAE